MAVNVAALPMLGWIVVAPPKEKSWPESPRPGHEGGCLHRWLTVLSGFLGGYVVDYYGGGEMSVDKKLVRKIQRLSQKFHDDLQEIFDGEMNQSTYEDSPAVESAVIAQGYAEDAANAEVEW